jgi:hypothetical protein
MEDRTRTSAAEGHRAREVHSKGSEVVQDLSSREGATSEVLSKEGTWVQVPTKAVTLNSREVLKTEASTTTTTLSNSREGTTGTSTTSSTLREDTTTTREDTILNNSREGTTT